MNPTTGSGFVAWHHKSPRESLDFHLGRLREPLARPGVQNLYGNADDSVWIEERGLGKYRMLDWDGEPYVFREDDRIALVHHLATVTGRGPITEDRASMSFTLPYGYGVRGQAFCPPIGPGWPLMLRRRAGDPLTDDDVVYEPCADRSRDRIVAPTFHEALGRAIDARWNILVAGPMNAGKTSHLEWIVGKMADARPTARVAAMEDVDEVRLRQSDYVKLYYDVRQQKYARGGGVVDYTYEAEDLVKDVLRTSADTYVFGELRSAMAARGLVFAANNGATGIVTTIHANSARHALSRLEVLIGSDTAARYDASPREMVADFANLVIYCNYDEVTRRRTIGAALGVYGLAGGGYDVAPIVRP